MRVAALTRSHYRFRPTNQNTKSLGRLLQRSDAYRLIFHGRSIDMHRCAAIAGLTILCFGLLAGNDNASASTQQPASPSKPTTTPRPVLLNGDWTGTLRVGDSQLHLILHLTGNARGDWHATLDSLDQAVYGMEAAKVTRSEDALEFDLPSVGAS